MPTRRQLLSIILASAAFVAMAVTAANLDQLETTKSDLGHGIAAARAANGVTVAWLTDYDPLLGGDKVVGATLVPDEGAILADSTVKLTIIGADGAPLGTISSRDGGNTWSQLTEPVAVSDSLVASVVIDDRETVAAVSGG
jgi:hypothetical protein